MPDIKEHFDFLHAEHPKARHLCFAWRLGTDGDAFKVNEDQKPSGRAGKPIPGQIDSAGLSQLPVAVVRYFGGTNPGVPGVTNTSKTPTSSAIASEIKLETRKSVHQAPARARPGTVFSFDGA